MEKKTKQNGSACANFQLFYSSVECIVAVAIVVKVEGKIHKFIVLMAHIADKKDNTHVRAQCVCIGVIANLNNALTETRSICQMKIANQNNRRKYWIILVVLVGCSLSTDGEILSVEATDKLPLTRIRIRADNKSLVEVHGGCGGINLLTIGQTVPLLFHSLYS